MVLKPSKKAFGEKASAAKDGFWSDRAQSSPDMKMGRRQDDHPNFIIHAFKKTRELLHAGGICPLGLPDKGDIPGQDHISALHSARLSYFSRPGNAKGIKSAGHPAFLAAPRRQAHPESNVAPRRDKARVPDENGIGMTLELRQIDHAAA